MNMEVHNDYQEDDSSMAADENGHDGKDKKKGQDNEEVVETSAFKIRGLISIVTMLAKSGKIKRQVTVSDVRKAARTGTSLTEEECRFASNFSNFLRTVVLQRNDEGNLPEINIFTDSSLSRLTNTVLSTIGLEK